MTINQIQFDRLYVLYDSFVRFEIQLKEFPTSFTSFFN